MKRAQLELAAKLYGLAMLAHLDGDPDTDEEGKVMHLANQRANTKLRNMGVDRSEVLTIGDAIDKAQEMRP